MNISEFKDVIWDHTRKINENTNKVFNPVCEKFGLTVLQIGILTELYKCESHTIGSLAERICAAGTNISSMCKKMESMGLLKRIREQNDERVVKVALTEKGREIAGCIDSFFNDEISKNIDSDAEKCLDTIVTGLRKLNELLQKIVSIKD